MNILSMSFAVVQDGGSAGRFGLKMKVGVKICMVEKEHHQVNEVLL